MVEYRYLQEDCRNIEMLSRRGKPCGPTFLFIFLLLLAGYGYYLYNEQLSKLVESEGKLGLIKKKQVSLKSQLHVVYEHRTKLEAALIKEKKNHRLTKQDFISKMKECHANLTKGKYESMNRFNALDTEHKMLKAKHEEVNTDYSNLQQQYVRLSEDHQKIVNGQKEDFERLKDTKDKESRSLQERVKTLYDEKEEQKAEASKYFGYYRSERNERVKITSTVQELKEKMAELEEKAASYEKERDDIKDKFSTAEDKIAGLERKIQELMAKDKQISFQEKDIRAKPTQASQVTTARRQEIQRRPSTMISNFETGKSRVRSPSKSIFEKTTSKSEQENVKSKILGRGTKAMIINLRPSDKVQGILLGRTTEMRKEDSLIDEYKNSETNKDDETQEAEDAERPTVEDRVQKSDNPGKVVRSTSASSSVFQGKKQETEYKTREVVDRKNDKKDVEANEARVDVDVERETERQQGEDKKTEDDSLNKHRISQYSKIKADADMASKGEKVEQVASEKEKEEKGASEEGKRDSHKESDDGQAFLKKQQQLMHRSAKTEEETNAAAVNRGVPAKKEKEADNSNVSKAGTISKERVEDEKVNVQKNDDDATKKETMDDMKSETTGGKTTEEVGYSEKNSKVKGAGEEGIKPKRVEEIRQLRAPVKSQSQRRKDDSQSIGKITVTEKKKMAESNEGGEKQVKMKQHKEQLHAPMRKPHPKDDKEVDPNLENENGDQDLDRTKNNDETENGETEDESRTGF